MKKNIKKIVVIGPESTGKSSLCAALANHYKTIWVKEFAREYLETNGKDYFFEDLYKIALGQLEEIENAVVKVGIQQEANTQNLLFIDTDLYVIKIWSEFVFNKCDNRILTEITKQQYDLYLLCDVDLPWVNDNLREYPDLMVRQKLFRYYNEEMTAQKMPWKIISGNYDERTMAAIEFIDQHLK